MVRRAWSIVALVLVACPSDEPGTGTTVAETGTGADSHDDHDGSETADSADTTGEVTTGEDPSTGATSGDGSSGAGGSSSGTGAASTGTAVDTWEGWALPSFFAVYCNHCHPAAGQSTRDFSDYDTVAANFEHIRCGVAPEAIDGCDAGHIEPGHLPIGPGPYPSDEERWRLVDWLDGGMPRD
jgi:hypothetical protein